MNNPAAGGEPRHVSVLPDEALAALDPRPGQVFVDATVGVGGHARLLAERLGPTGRLIGLDRDASMLDLARPRLDGLPVTLVHANFDALPDVLGRLGVTAVDGVLADLGVCSDQLDQAERGFSFSQPAPLDMRLDSGPGDTAAALLRRLNERDLADLFWQYGEERFSRRIARRIVETRRLQPLETTDQLAELVRRCVPRPPRGGKRKPPIDPATRVFQALRIAVNDELGALERLLAALPGCLKPGGRAAIISFHSLEDRRVKQAFRDRTRWQELTRKPVQAGEEEVTRNPRAQRQAACGRSPRPAGAPNDPGRGRRLEEIPPADLDTGGRPHAPPLLARGAWKVTRKSQYGWMVVGGILCLCGGVVALKLREGNPAIAQGEPPPRIVAPDAPLPPLKGDELRLPGAMKPLDGPTDTLPPINHADAKAPTQPAEPPPPPSSPPPQVELPQPPITEGPPPPSAGPASSGPPAAPQSPIAEGPPSPSAAPDAAPPSDPLPNAPEVKETKAAPPGSIDPPPPAPPAVAQVVTHPETPKVMPPAVIQVGEPPLAGTGRCRPIRCAPPARRCATSPAARSAPANAALTSTSSTPTSAPRIR